MEQWDCREVVEWVRKILDPNSSAEEREVCHLVSSIFLLL